MNKLTCPVKGCKTTTGGTRCIRHKESAVYVPKRVKEKR
jgi:hypothetical protein